MESKTEIFRRGVIKRFYKQTLPNWVGRLKGRGFYVIHRKWKTSPPHVVKGVVGEVVISSIQEHLKGPEMFTNKRYFQFEKLKHNRGELVVKVNLYTAPFDVFKTKDTTHGNPEYYGITGTGYLGTYSLMDLYKTKHEAMEDLKKKTDPLC